MSRRISSWRAGDQARAAGDRVQGELQAGMLVGLFVLGRRFELPGVDRGPGKSLDQLPHVVALRAVHKNG
jgi:hypothetical protein